MIRRILYLLLSTVILGGLGGAIAFYAFDFKPKMLAEVILGAPVPPETVSAEAARTDTWQPQISGIGTLTAFQGIDITPQVGGIVTEVNFVSGEDVPKGKLLVKLDAQTEEADMRSILAELANTDMDLIRREALAAKGVVARLAGIDAPVFEDNEKTIADLKARIANTIAFIQSVSPAQIDGTEDKAIVTKRGDKETHYKGMQFLLGHAIPNFYFHVSTTYNILRHNGVVLGKLDFLNGPEADPLVG